MLEGLLLVVWSSTGLWVVGWVRLWVQSFYSAMGWVGLCWVGSIVWLVGFSWIEEIGPTDNSGLSLVETGAQHIMRDLTRHNSRNFRWFNLHAQTF